MESARADSFYYRQIMRRLKNVVIAVGVTLIVAPIFSSAWAQTQQTQTLLQMQTLREEIGQLRDMVERQGRTIQLLERRLNQGVSQAAPGNQQYGSQNPNSGALGGVPGNTSNPTVLGGQSDIYQGPQSEPFDQNTQNDIEPFSTSPAVNPNTAGVPNLPAQDGFPSATERPVFDQTQEGLNRPFDPNLPSNPQIPNNTQNGGVVVDERAVSPAPIPSGQDGFPPVVDRSIGARQPVEQAPTGQNQVPNQSSSTFNTEPLDNSQASTGSLEPFNSAPANNNFPTTAPIEPTANSGAVSVPPFAGNSSQIPVPQTVPQVGSANSSRLLETDLYNQGFELLKQSKFEEASAVFEKQIQAYPQGNLADDAHYWISEAMTMVSNTEAARVNLKAIVDKYPQSSRVPDARLRLAYIEERKGNLIEARILLQEVVTKYPQSDAAIAAKNRLETLQ